MKIKMNENFLQFQDNYLFVECAKRINDYSKKHPDKRIIKLSIGDVTRPLPKIVIEALHEAVDEQASSETFRGYAPENGYEFLREAIAKYYKGKNVDLNSDEIFVSDGAKCDCGNILDILGNNTIYVPDPVYPVYVDSNIMRGNNIKYLRGSIENGFLPLPDESIEEGSIIYICSPNNPTGSVYDYQSLQKWVNFANSKGCLIVFDSAYEAFIDGDEPRSIFEIKGSRTCALEICSLSKTAGFTGTRCGWMIIPFELESENMSLNKAWSRRQSTKFNGVPYIVQRAACAALSNEGLRECMENIAYYKENANLLSKFLDEKNIQYIGGKSSPYLWIKAPNNMKSWEFFDFLLENAQIAGTPGVGFGQQGEGYLRLTSFGKREDYIEAISRLSPLF